MIQRILQAFRKPDPRVAAARVLADAKARYNAAVLRRDTREQHAAAATMADCQRVILRGRG